MRKYEIGERIMSLDVLMEQEFVFFQDKVYCSGWFHGWMIGCVRSWINYRGIYKAIRKEITNENERTDYAIGKTKRGNGLLF